MSKPSKKIKTSRRSSRKYPNVMWFPRSKTDPKEIREVLKLALQVQSENPENYFNDKILGEHMARIGSINVVDYGEEEYIKSYAQKSTGDVSFITNARMLMRLFRFLGLVTRVTKGRYQVTDRGIIFSKFTGEFPNRTESEDEESLLLQSLRDFAFYCVNDDPAYRDRKFKVRPFIWLLHTLSLEPQCIFQLIVTSYASRNESNEEVDRIKSILQSLRNGKSNIADEFRRLRLNPNDYSCVHNFYDSAKILVYLGVSLGLITKESNPEYGRRIIGSAKYLTQANTFYKLTEKGHAFLEQNNRGLLYYEDLYNSFGEKNVLEAAFLLGALNFELGSVAIAGISKNFIESILGIETDQIISALRKELGIEIANTEGVLSLKTPLSFNFWQSIPPEFMQREDFQQWFTKLKDESLRKRSAHVKLSVATTMPQKSVQICSKFILGDSEYSVPPLSSEQLISYTKYLEQDDVHGGQDRFASRISPTNTVTVINEQVHVDNKNDALDLLVPLRLPDPELVQFIENNMVALLQNFSEKSSAWEKDQHYSWVRNCFRLFGIEAIYSGSAGMLSRADVSIINPIIAGIEAKSPRENRGSINTKAIRQAVDAMIQVAHKFPEKNNLPRTAVAIGARITPRAIAEEKKWSKESRPVLLMTDQVLYYLTLKTASVTLDEHALIEFLTTKSGVVTPADIKLLLQQSGASEEELNRVESELANVSFT